MRSPHLDDGDVVLYAGDCVEVMRELPEASVDAIVTDPPYGLEFMGKDWDRPWAVSASNGVGYAGRDDLHLPAHRDSRNANCRNCGGRQRGANRCSCKSPKWDRDPADDMRAFQAFSEAWARESYRVLKPGGHLLAFAGTRTYHRMAAGVEDAGFEIRDCIAWMYGSGFPKSRNLDGEWTGWGTALKPAFEPIVVARKPLTSTVAQNVLEHGTGALNIDACRIDMGDEYDASNMQRQQRSDGAVKFASEGLIGTEIPKYKPRGRWPANVALDETAATMLDQQSGDISTQRIDKPSQVQEGKGWSRTLENRGPRGYTDNGGASRFFYTAKASRQDRNAGGLADNTHPTVKPTDLMRWLIRLVTPPGGIILDPFGGSGSTGLAARAENVRCILIEREPEYLQIISDRLAQLSLFAEVGEA